MCWERWDSRRIGDCLIWATFFSTRSRFAFKDVAAARGTGERTARTQGLSMYQTAGVRGAHVLTAFFLEEVLKSDLAFVREHAGA